jgi:hypothetical protein
VGGGGAPRWSRAGSQLFYLSQDFHVMVIDYTVKGDVFVPGVPRRFSDAQINPVAGRPSFDIAPDGKRILAFPVNEQEPQAGNLRSSFLLNFFDEVKRRLP